MKTWNNACEIVCMPKSHNPSATLADIYIPQISQRFLVYQMFATKSVRFAIAIFQRPPVGLLNYDSWRYVPTVAAAFFDKENNICTAHGNPPPVREDNSCNTCTKKTLYSLTQSRRKVYSCFASFRATYFDFNRNKHPKTRKRIRFFREKLHSFCCHMSFIYLCLASCWQKQRGILTIMFCPSGGLTITHSLEFNCHCVCEEKKT